MWDKIKELFGDSAPIVGGLLGGPAGAAVGGLLSKALGVENNASAIEKELINNPDASNSYCSNSTASYPLNYTGNVGESISCYLDRTNNVIKVLTSDDKSGFTGKIVILYTK